jgi:Cu2+-exporting ATPase
VQRLADVVAGRFCYGVMAASSATFAFWSLAGANLFPQALGEWGSAGYREHSCLLYLPGACLPDV